MAFTSCQSLSPALWECSFIGFFFFLFPSLQLPFTPPERGQQKADIAMDDWKRGGSPPDSAWATGSSQIRVRLLI